MTIFKTGDKVRYTGKYKNHTPERVGKTGTVREATEYSALVTWDDGSLVATNPFPENLELVEGLRPQEGDRVRFSAAVYDYTYSHKGVPYEYNGIEGTVMSAYNGAGRPTARVQWDPSLIGERTAFVDNLEVIERPAPARKTVVVEFDAPADEDIEALVKQVIELTEVKYTLKEDTND